MYEGLAVVVLLVIGLVKLGKYEPKVKSKFKIGDEVKLTEYTYLAFHGYPETISIVTRIVGRENEDKAPLIHLSKSLCASSGSTNAVSEQHLELVEHTIDLSQIQ